MNTIEAIKRRISSQDTLVCAGIDPVIDRFPEEIRVMNISDEEKVKTFLKSYIGIVAPHICVFKAQKAYFDVFPGGHDVLKEIIQYAHQHDIPVIVDCKIGDIDETMNAYIKNIFELLKADGVVVNPYMGDDVMLPFARYPEKAIVPLVKSSNPGGAVIQDARMEDGGYLWQHVLDLVMHRWNTANNMVPIIASTQQIDTASVRRVMGDDTLALFAGMGAQGGTTKDLKGLLDSHGAGVFVNSSRGLLYPTAEAQETWGDAIKRAVTTLQSALNLARL